EAGGGGHREGQEEQARARAVDCDAHRIGGGAATVGRDLGEIDRGGRGARGARRADRDRNGRRAAAGGDRGTDGVGRERGRVPRDRIGEGGGGRVADDRAGRGGRALRQRREAQQHARDPQQLQWANHDGAGLRNGSGGGDTNTSPAPLMAVVKD